MGKIASMSGSARTTEPVEASPTLDAFFQQTLSDMGWARRFLQERWPQQLVAHLAPSDPVLVDTDFVDTSGRLTVKKVLRVPLIGGYNLLVRFVIDQESAGRPPAIVKLALDCGAILSGWYERERRKEENAHAEAPEPVPLVAGVIVNTGLAPFAHAIQLRELWGSMPDEILEYTLGLEAVLVDLSVVEDQDLSTDSLLRARLVAQKHATDDNLRENLDNVLKAAGIAELPEPHGREIMRFLATRVGGLEPINDSLRRIASR